MPRNLSPLSLIFPQACLLCGRTSRIRPVCSRCHPVPIRGERCRCCHSIAAILESERCELCASSPPLFRHLRYAWEYEAATRPYIRFMKYHPSRRLCRYTGTCLAAMLPHWFDTYDWDLVIPIPSSISQLRQRTFNQCVLIARPIAHALHLPLPLFALSRTDRKAPQASLRHEQRPRNVLNAFTAAPRLVTGRRVLLVDDVITTGATTAAAITALAKAGAESVDVVAAARAPAWLRYRSAVEARFPGTGLFPSSENVP